MQRVVVTGIGAVTPIGMASAGLYAGMRRPRSAVARLTRFDPSPFRCQVAAEVGEFDPLAYMDAKRARRLDRFAQFAVAAARQGVDDAGLHLEDVDRDRCGCFIGGGRGGGARVGGGDWGIFREENTKERAAARRAGGSGA